ncbi:MmgE/PrpD family protein, partial [Desulfovibrio sp. OttesenSCG-928-I05]|nr:MmgE/PrpD family protein [Desulfovibrio sp. OttesenSCG-928-I05]
LTYADIPENVREYAKTLLLDSIACCVGAVETPLGRSVLSLANAMGGNALSRIPGTDVTTSPALAAFCAGTLSNALDYDDTGHFGHPGATVIPAIMALSGMQQISGEEFLTAMIVGYEVIDRTARAIQPSLERYDQIHGSGTLQILGSVTACAKLLGLTPEETLNAIGIAAANTPVAHAGKFGWEDKSITSVKDNVALPAELGLRSALLAREGYEGSESILDGHRGFWVMAGSDRCNYDILEDYSSFNIMNVAIKPYPCCRWIHTGLRALETLMTDHGFDADDIERLDVATTPPVASRFAAKSARTFIDMEFSTPLTMALMMRRIPKPEWFREKHWKDPETERLAAMISLRPDDDLMALFVELGREASHIPTRVTATLKDGRELSHMSDTALGAPQFPLSREAHREKIDGLLLPGLGAEKAARLIETVQRLETLKDAGDLARAAAL